MAIDRERRVIGHLVVEIEPAKPSVRKVKFKLFAQSPLEADAVAIANDQHSDHQLGINRRPANLAIEGHKLLTKLHQYPGNHRIDPPQQMPCWNAPFEVEQVKQLALITSLLTHHGKPPQPNPSSRRNHRSPKIASPFSTPSVMNDRMGMIMRGQLTPSERPNSLAALGDTTGN